MKTYRLGRSAVAAICVLLLGACGAQVEGTDSSTHWLDQCNKDSDCSSGLSCECGSCTKTCDMSKDCNGLAEATCVTTQCSARQVSACARTCSGDTECGDGTCIDGACTFALQCDGQGCLIDQDASTTGDTSDASDVDADTIPSGETQSSGGTESTTDASVAPGNDCPAMDVADPGTECLGDLASYWNGSECVSVEWCGCTGADCENLFTHVEDCRSHYAACIDDIPECTDEIELEEDDTGAVSPLGQQLWFKVVGEEPGQYEEDPDAAPLADFTEAEWRGTEAPDAGGDVSYTLTFLVGSERHVVWLYFGNSDWPLPGDLAGLGDMVEVRIVRVGDGVPVELQVRDASGVPLLWFVQSAPTGAKTEWSFDDLSARVGAPICKRVTQPCNWLFTLGELVVSFEGEEATLGPSQGTNIGQGPPSYQVMNDFQFSNNLTAFGDESCASAIPRKDAFVLWREDDPEGD